MTSRVSIAFCLVLLGCSLQSAAGGRMDEEELLAESLHQVAFDLDIGFLFGKENAFGFSPVAGASYQPLRYLLLEASMGAAVLPGSSQASNLVLRAGLPLCTRGRGVVHACLQADLGCGVGPFPADEEPGRLTWIQDLSWLRHRTGSIVLKPRLDTWVWLVRVLLEAEFGTSIAFPLYDLDSRSTDLALEYRVRLMMPLFGGKGGAFLRC